MMASNKSKLSLVKKGTFKRLLKMMLSFFPILIPSVLLLILVNAVISAIPAVFQQNIIAIIEQTLKTHGSWATASGKIFGYLAVLILLYVLSLLASFGYTRLMAVITQGALAKFRKVIFEKMETLPIRYFDTNAHGDIMSTYTNDIDALRQMVSQSFPQLTSTFIVLITLACIMMYYSFNLFMVVVLGLILMLIVTKELGERSAKYFVKQQVTLGETEGYIEEMMNGQKVIKVFNHEQESLEGFDKVNDAWFESSRRANTYSNILGPILHNMTKQFTGSIGQVSQQINSVIMGLAGAARIFNLLDQESEEDNGYVTLVNVREENDELVETSERTEKWAWKHPHADGTITLSKMEGDVQLEHVDFAYNPDKMILHDISVFAKPGQKVAFVGATGAGKTTITNLINRFYDIKDGKIRYDGINIDKIKKSNLRRSLGIVLQDTNLFTGTVMDNIRYGYLEAGDAECQAAAKLVGAHDFITRLPEGYNTKLDNNGSNLSQGQRQLIAIARAAVANPPVMILDEATSSIDTRTEAIVQRGMDALMYGRTVFVIAHRLSTVQNSDVIMVLDQGRIIERGNHEDLIKQKGQYYQLYTGAFELE